VSFSVSQRFLVFGALAFAAALVWTPRASFGAGGPYTDDQAKRGAAVYADKCSACHGQNLEGVSGPPLSGAQFMQAWSSKTADDLYSFIQNNMPMDAPSSLSADDYLAVLALIMQKNGFPSGDTPLAAANLKQVPLKK
jgi:mono/diheme cytochrome c family protein